MLKQIHQQSNGPHHTNKSRAGAVTGQSRGNPIPGSAEQPPRPVELVNTLNGKVLTVFFVSSWRVSAMDRDYLRDGSEQPGMLPMQTDEIARALKHLPPDRQLRMACGLRALGEAMADAAMLQVRIEKLALPFSELHECGLEGRDLRWLLACGAICGAGKAHSGDPLEIHPDIHYFLDPVVACVLLDWSASLFGGSPPSRSDRAPESGKPRWDEGRGQLWWNDCLVKEFRVPARSQTLILSAFQELGWATRIDDPLPHCRQTKRADRLREAIRGLNRNQRTQVLSFSGDGRAEGVRWRIRGNCGDSANTP